MVPNFSQALKRPLNGAMCAPLRIFLDFRILWTHKQRQVHPVGECRRYPSIGGRGTEGVHNLSGMVPNFSQALKRPLNGAMCAPIRIFLDFRILWTHKQRQVHPVGECRRYPSIGGRGTEGVHNLSGLAMPCHNISDTFNWCSFESN